MTIWGSSIWGSAIAAGKGEVKTFEITDPVINAAVITSIIDNYEAVIITLTGVGNIQTLQNPTTVTIKQKFIVANNDTSTDPITVNTIVLAPGQAQNFFWDGSAWLTLESFNASNISIIDAADIITAEDVEGALQENREAILDAGVNLNYWFGNATLDLALMDSEAALTETPDTDPKTLTTITFKSSVIDTPTPFMISPGTIMLLHFAADVTTVASKLDTQLQFILGYVDSDGTSNFTQIGQTTDLTAVLTAAKTSYDVHLHFATGETVPSGKRLWLKVIADSSGTGSYAEINMYYDAIEHHISLGVSGGVLGNFVKKSGDTMSGPLNVTSINGSYVTVASHAVTSAIWAAAGNIINFTGAETITDFPAADRAGSTRTLICAGATVFTHGGDITVQGGATYTAAANEIVIVTATTTTAFHVRPPSNATHTGDVTGKIGLILGVNKVTYTHTVGSSKVLTPVTGSTTGFAAGFTGANLYGGTYIVSSDDGDLQLPLMVEGMNFTIITLGVIEVVADTHDDDGYLMDGVTNAEGKNLTNLSTAGDIAVFQYYTADDWLITTNGWTPEA